MTNSNQSFINALGQTINTIYFIKYEMCGEGDYALKVSDGIVFIHVFFSRNVSILYVTFRFG